MKRTISLLLALTLALCLLGASAFAGSGTVGEYYDEIVASVSEGQYIDNFNASGSLPAGLEFGLNSNHNQIRLYGTPSAAGSATVTLNYTVVTEETGDSASESATVSVSISAAAPTPDPSKAPKITKSPTSETRPEGGDTLFIAKAENYDHCYWQFISPDGTDMSAAEFQSKFPNVYISGSNTTTLAISGFEKAMTGYKVICVFDGKGGRAVTDAATITVTEKPSPSAKPSATAAPSPSASAAPSPSASPAHEHKFDKNWKSDESKHWHECDCGLKADEAEHTVSEWATKADGTQQGICTVCGAVATKAAAAVTPVPAPAAKSGSNTLLIVILVIVLLVLAAAAAFLFGRMRSAKAAAEPEFKAVKDDYNPRHDGIHDEEDRAEDYRQQLEDYENKK